MNISTDLDSAATRLQRVLEIAATVPGQRQRFLEAGLLAAQTKSSEPCLSADWKTAFLNLRPLDKATIRQQPGQFLANAQDIVYRGNTSGSRGAHFTYFAGAEWNQARQQARERSLAWWGIDQQTPMVNVASRLLPVRPVDRAIAGAPSPEFMQRFLALLAERPAVMRGYPSRLCEVAVQFVGQPVPPVIAVICTGECLFEFQTALLEKVFNAPVINEYGCQETGISGLTCPEAGRLHLDADRCLYEIMDGHLVTTDLLNHVMPMVRYQCGDRLELSYDPCPCGRPGPTAKLLGRVEDRLRTVNGSTYPGEVSMPAITGILSYQVIREAASRVTLRIQPDLSSPYLSLVPLFEWATATFGDVSAEILLDDRPTVGPTTAPAMDDDAWIHAVTQGSWSTWLNASLPRGKAAAIAQLLKELVHPAVVLYSGLPASTLTKLETVLNAESSVDSALEQLTARVLLFACSFLSGNPDRAIPIYRLAAQRLQTTLQRSQPSPAIIDALIPALYFDTETARSLWAEWSRWLDADTVQHYPLDTFNVHHLLQAFEPAAAIALQRRSTVGGSARSRSILSDLRPVVAVLIGDLSGFAPRFGLWLVAHWFELLHGHPATHQQFCPPATDQFSTAWLNWRQHLLVGHVSDAARSALLRAAQRPEEQARAHLEHGYAALVMQQPLEPQTWLRHLQTHAGVLGGEQPLRSVDPTPWIPILKALASGFLANGNPNLAYECLVAAAPPSSRIAAFERLAFKVNDKQSVLYDRASQF